MKGIIVSSQENEILGKVWEHPDPLQMRYFEFLGVRGSVF
jgi:hypothetical protein